MSGFLHILRFNPNHDALGRFSSGPSGVKSLDGLGIARKDMPQIASADMPEFFDFARAKGVKVTSTEADVAELRPSQSEYNAAQAAQMPEAALRKALTISKDGYVLDGHNRWARLVEQKAGKVSVNQIDLTAQDALALMHSFPKAFRKDVSQVGATVKKGFAHLLKFNPYHGSDGRFTTADGASMAEDMKKQFQWLHEKAQAFGYKDADEMAEKNPEAFASLAGVWRKTHVFKGFAGLLSPKKEAAPLFKFDPSQPRDDSGRWTSTGAGVNSPAFKAWFGNSQITNPDGTPQVMYHGTYADFDSFIPRGNSQYQYVFLTPHANAAARIATEQHKRVGALAYKDKELPALMESMRRWGKEQGATDAQIDAAERNMLEARNSAVSVMPLYVKAEKPFDYKNPEHVAALEKHLAGVPGLPETLDDDGQPIDGWTLKDDIESGNWKLLEHPKAQDYIAKHFDAFWLNDDGPGGAGRSLAVYRPNQLKSATGNRGTYDPKDDRVTKYDPNQPRDQDGKWTATGAGVNSPAFKEWFGKSKITNPDGTPKVLYHGTRGDIEAFVPKQAGAIYLTPSKRFAGYFAEGRHTAGGGNKELEDWVEEDRAEGANVMPVFVRAENPFDPSNPAHLKGLVESLPIGDDDGWPVRVLSSFDFDGTLSKDSFAEENAAQVFNDKNNWRFIESPEVQAYIRQHHDGFWTTEVVDGIPTKNLAVYDPNQIKSAIGNSGAYSRTDRRVTKGFAAILKFDPNQPRDKDGKWTSTGAVAVAEEDGGHRLTLTVQGKAVGDAFLKYKANEDKVILWSVGVKPEHQGKGHGSQLLDAALATARAKYPGKEIEVDAIEPRLAGALQRRGAKQPYAEAPGVFVLKYDPNQPRAADGKWTTAGIGSSARMDSPSRWKSPEEVTAAIEAGAKASKADILAGKVPLLSMGDSSKVGPGVVAQYQEDGTVKLFDGFFNDNEFGKRMTLAHEFGHEAAMRMFSGGTASERASEVFRPFRSNPDNPWNYDNPAGASTRPEEMAADMYAQVYASNRQEYLWEDPGRHQEAYRHILEVAGKAGLPLPEWTRKFDPNQPRDEDGQWTRIGAGKVYTRKEIQASLEHLKGAGAELGDDPEYLAEEIWQASEGKFNPLEVAKAMLGEEGMQDENTIRGLKFRVDGFKVSVRTGVGSTDSSALNIHGAKAVTLSRVFDFLNKEVYHSVLELHPGAQGAGAVRKLFSESIPLYLKMGMEKIDLHANYDLGAYAWSRYGFKAEDPRHYAAMVADEAKYRLRQIKNLTPEAREEAENLQNLLNTQNLNPKLPQYVTDLKTPHLDRQFIEQKIYPSQEIKRPTFIKGMLFEKSWTGYFNLKDKAELVRLKRYLTEPVKKKFDPAQPRDEDGRWTLGPGVNPDHHYGITHDRDKGWVDRRGNPMPEREANRLKALKIPPAWKNVALNPDETAALQATGEDSKGRTQYRYSKEHSERATAEKFGRLAEFSKIVGGLRKKIATELSRTASDALAALHIIAQTGLRPGSDNETGGAVKAYGVTTLLNKHAKTNGDKVSLRFPGKKGVINTRTFTDALTADHIRRKGLRRPNQRLFDTSDAKIREAMRELGAEGFTPKDFRTWHATAKAILVLKKMPKPKTEKEAKKLKLAVAKKVAAYLGNTPTVALNSYINPTVFDEHFKGTLVKRAEDNDSLSDLEQAMEEFFATHSFDDEGNWRDMPELGEEEEEADGFAAMLTVEKANPYHDKAGRFTFANNANFMSIGGIFDKQRDNANRRAGLFGPRKPSNLGQTKPAETPAVQQITRTLQQVRSELRELNSMGIQMFDDATALHGASKGRFSPMEAVKALLGPGGVTPENIRGVRITKVGLNTVQVSARRVNIFGGKVNLLERSFNFASNDVHHDYLEVAEEDQGRGIVRRLFASSMPLYHAMGMKSISLTANLEGGAYAWGRYGFKTSRASYFVRQSEDALRHYFGDGDGLERPAQAELKNLRDLLARSSDNPDIPRLFTEAQTPHLNAYIHQNSRLFDSDIKRPNAAKVVLYDKNWSGYIKFDDAASMARLDAYLKGKTGTKKGFAEVLKANPYHDKIGRFTFANNANFVSIGGIFDKQRQRAKERAAQNPPRDSNEPRTLTLDETKAELQQLFDAGVAMDEGPTDTAKAIHEMSGGKLSPMDVLKAFMGAGNGTEENLRRVSFSVRPWSKEVTVQVAGGKVYGSTVQLLKRTFNFESGDVHHDFLRFPNEDQGAGVARKLFAASLPLYKRMGMKSISLTANLNLGGYAWARYGFKTGYPEGFKGMVERSMNYQRQSPLGSNLSEEAKKEFMDLKALLRHNISSPDLPRLFAEAQTPHLDKHFQPTGVQMGLRNPRFAKVVLYNDSWGGYIKFNDKASMDRLEAYLARDDKKKP